MARTTPRIAAVAITVLAASLLLTGCVSGTGENDKTAQIAELQKRGFSDVEFANQVSIIDGFGGQNHYWVTYGTCRLDAYIDYGNHITLVVPSTTGYVFEIAGPTADKLEQSSSLDVCRGE